MRRFYFFVRIFISCLQTFPFQFLLCKCARPFIFDHERPSPLPWPRTEWSPNFSITLSGLGERFVPFPLFFFFPPRSRMEGSIFLTPGPSFFVLFVFGFGVFFGPVLTSWFPTVFFETPLTPLKFAQPHPPLRFPSTFLLPFFPLFASCDHPSPSSIFIVSIPLPSPYTISPLVAHFKK